MNYQRDVRSYGIIIFNENEVKKLAKLNDRIYNLFRSGFNSNKSPILKSVSLSCNFKVDPILFWTEPLLD